MTLYFISATTDDGESLDWHVSARTPYAAFVLWRKFDFVKCCSGSGPVKVFPIGPSGAKKPCVHDWNHADSRTYKL
jgi:hypothetical protein